MYKIESKKLPNTKYCLSYAEAVFYCKVYGLRKSAIKPVH